MSEVLILGFSNLVWVGKKMSESLEPNLGRFPTSKIYLFVVIVFGLRQVTSLVLEFVVSFIISLPYLKYSKFYRLYFSVRVEQIFQVLNKIMLSRNSCPNPARVSIFVRTDYWKCLVIFGHVFSNKAN